MSLIGPSGEAAIHERPTDISTDQNIPEYSDQELIMTYEIAETVEWVRSNGYRIVGLQFPDHLLHISVRIFKLLRAQLPISSTGQLGKPDANESTAVEIYLLADTTYGSCCVDCLAAQHVAADAIIHYGPACLTTTAHLAVYYVLPKLALQDADLSSVVKELYNGFRTWFDEVPQSNEADPPQILLMYDVGYHWKVDQVYESLKAISTVPIQLHMISTQSLGSLHAGETLEPRTMSGSCCKPNPRDCVSTSTQTTPCCGASTKRDEPPNISSITNVDSTRIDQSPHTAILYLGPCSRRLTHLMLTHSSIPIFALDPSSLPFSCHSQIPLVKKLLMKRYATIQRARDADVFGILVGTLGLQHDLNLMARTKALIEDRFKKKSYTISVGKLKPEKLINFLEIECWVLIACPEHSLLDEGISVDRSKQFNVPVITPWELDLALSSCLDQSTPSVRRREWDGRYVLDFERLLSIWNDEDGLGSDPDAVDGQKEAHGDEDAPVFSMITGKYKYRKQWNQSSENNEVESGVVTKRNERQELIQVVNGAASEYALHQRTYQGLEPRIGMDEPSRVEKGRFGIAQSYGDDHVEG